MRAGSSLDTPAGSWLEEPRAECGLSAPAQEVGWKCGGHSAGWVDPRGKLAAWHLFYLAADFVVLVQSVAEYEQFASEFADLVQTRENL